MESEKLLAIAEALVQFSENLERENPASGPHIVLNPIILNETKNTLRVLNDLFRVASKGGEASKTVQESIATAKEALVQSNDNAIRDVQKDLRRLLEKMLKIVAKASERGRSIAERIKQEHMKMLFNIMLNEQSITEPDETVPQSQDMPDVGPPSTTEEIVTHILENCQRKTIKRYESLISQIVDNFLTGNDKTVTVTTNEIIDYRRIFKKSRWFFLLESKNGRRREVEVRIARKP